MNQRGMSTLAAVFGSALLGLVAATFIMDWMVVDVAVPADDVRIVAPVPLFLADIALAFVPDEALEGAEIPPELIAQREAILEGLDALLEHEQATLVEVDTPHERVELRLDRGDLVVAVDADDARVRCTLPLDGVHRALEDWDWQTVDPGLALDVLHSARSGPIVDVQADDGTTVRITMW